MAKYFLDTHTLLWYINNSGNLDKNIRFDITYPSGNSYSISNFVLLEIIQLKQLGKISLNLNSKQLYELLYEYEIGIDFTTPQVFEVLDNLPLLKIEKTLHSDMIDRAIIAHCIAHRYTCISHDRKFPEYRKFGLKLIES